MATFFFAESSHPARQSTAPKVRESPSAATSFSKGLRGSIFIIPGCFFVLLLRHAMRHLTKGTGKPVGVSCYSPANRQATLTFASG